ncbi:MAG: hypothetical protein AAB250_13710 [Bdellovibrionota bacterium]
MKEISRLFTIVLSTASIAWAGQIAHSSEAIKADAVFRATEQVLATQAESRDRALTRFAAQEIRRMSELSQALTERAEILPAGPEPTDARIRKALDELDESLLLSRHALMKLKGATAGLRKFAEENMKSQLFRLQDSARGAQGLFIARESAQSFSVSKTGQ